MNFSNIIQIKPNDNLFLGSGKSFSKGENTWLGTRTIPYSSVFYGAICSIMLVQNEERRKKYIDNKELDSDPRKYLSLGNVYLYNEEDDEVYMSAPLDLYLDEDEECHYAIIKKIKNNINCSEERMSHLFFNETKGESQRVDNMFIKYRNFYNSYYNTNKGIGIIKNSDIVTNSYKVGIERDKSYVAREKHLYRIDLTEFKKEKWSYLVEYNIKDSWWNEEIKNIKDGYLKLGGENKVCRFYTYDKIKKMMIYSNLYNQKNEIEYIKMILTSPCIFKENDYIPKLKDIEVIASSIGKSYDIGGFDMVLKIPKPMSKAVPEGSVYVLKSKDFKNKSLEKIKNTIDEGLIDEKYKGQGFGMFELVPLDELQIEGEEIYE
ncbi:type III-B CRISPR module-associated protein Cmr3 [Clostridium botulinum]|nr:type III-B CRISPR module-associated protein Cmr3 [Clostridium botulinum]NFD32104.1 type III-B CRISPR module-associated protein Cmr3 [Clostridium botulinum]NFD58011.1 type III-B CRISPR module-associated protein Cmr3 [Clostridium botulinum]NFD99969.1 type III-B CRISPR module-associated protein Cmr3 [Clostridium botulinum]